MLSAILTAGLALVGAVSARPLPRAAPNGGKVQPLRKRDVPTAAPWFFYYDDQPADGFPDPTTLTGWNAFGLGFYLSTEGPFDLAAEWAQKTADDRNATLQSFHDAGLLLFVSAFGGTDTPTTSGVDPTTLGQQIGAYVTQYGLDGIDVDYEDLNAMNGGTAVPWLVTFTQTLRASVPDGVFISHAPLAPWFTTNTAAYPSGDYLAVDQQAGSDIDFYNIQFYNQGTAAYTDCTSLISQSSASSDLTNYPGTSILEIMASGISGDKLVLGKPGGAGDASSGQIDPSTLAGCVSTAKQGGWNGGLMVWEYPDAPADYVSTVWGA